MIKYYGNIRNIGFVMNVCRKINTYKGKLSNIYAGQVTKTYEKAAFSYISDFPVQKAFTADRRQALGSDCSHRVNRRATGGGAARSGMPLVATGLSSSAGFHGWSTAEAIGRWANGRCGSANAAGLGSSGFSRGSSGDYAVNSRWQMAILGGLRTFRGERVGCVRGWGAGGS